MTLVKEIRGTTDIFEQVGLLSLFIIDESGLPLLVRNYVPNKSSEEENILITSFSSAISLFAQNMLISFISDIGLGMQRFFFKYQSGFIYLLSFDTTKLHNLRLQQVHELIVIAVWELDHAVREFYEKASGEVKKFAISTTIEKLTPQLDQLIAKGCSDWKDIAALNSKNLSDLQLTNNPKNSLSEMIDYLGLKAVFILDKENKPIFKAIYDSKSPLVLDSSIMASFLTAISSFAKTMLFSSITDIGMFNQRIFIKSNKPYTFVLVIDDLKFLLHSRSEEDKILQRIFVGLIKDAGLRIASKKRKRRNNSSKHRKRTKNSLKIYSDDELRNRVDMLLCNIEPD
jgi:hypothetical protein